MKQNSNFLLRQVAGSTVVVPVGPAARRFPGMMRLNESGQFLWEQLKSHQTEESLTQAMVARYEVSTQQAAQDVATFLERLRSVGALDETDG